jgi:hypothetical protein
MGVGTDDRRLVQHICPICPLSARLYLLSPGRGYEKRSTFELALCTSSSFGPTISGYPQVTWLTLPSAPNCTSLSSLYCTVTAPQQQHLPHEHTPSGQPSRRVAKADQSMPGLPAAASHHYLPACRPERGKPSRCLRYTPTPSRWWGIKTRSQHHANSRLPGRLVVSPARAPRTRRP